MPPKCLVLLFALLPLYTLALVRTNYQAPYQRVEHDIIEGDYIVHFNPGHDLVKHQRSIGKEVSKSEIFHTLDFLPGYRATLDNHTIHELVRRDPGVKLVENNARVHLVEPVYRGDVISDPDAISDPEITFDQDANETQFEKRASFTGLKVVGAPFNLLMVAGGSKLSTPVTGGEYSMVRKAGKFVRVYIMDTGINIQHPLFESRAINFNGQTTTPYLDPAPGNPPVTIDDIGGHGTHVAGIVGARQYGVAESATIINVKVLADEILEPGVTDSQALIAQAISDITTDHNNFKNQNNPATFRGSVINMSFTNPGGGTAAYDQALRLANQAGIILVAAAGNVREDASGFFPCSSPTTICVGSVDNEYQTSDDFTNFGNTIKLSAPGTDIISLDKGPGSGVLSMSGTSMATAHVSGICAIFIFWEALTSNAATVANRLRSNQLPGILSGKAITLKGTPNQFATTGLNNAKRSPNGPYVNAPKPVGNPNNLIVDNSIAVDGGAVNGGNDTVPSGSAGSISFSSLAAIAVSTLPGDELVGLSIPAGSTTGPDIVVSTSLGALFSNSAPPAPSNQPAPSSFAAAGNSAASSFAAAGNAAASSFAAAGNSALSSFAAAGNSAASSFAAAGNAAASSFAAGF